MDSLEAEAFVERAIYLTLRRSIWSSKEDSIQLITSLKARNVMGEDATRQYPTLVSTWFNVDGVGMFGDKVIRNVLCCVERDAWLRGELTLSSLDVLQGFSFFLQIGFILILATLDGLDVCLLGDVIDEDDCDDGGGECIYSGRKV
ncbi:hypothetical protein Tco_1212080 [Tanacetum coccineum]